MGVGVMRPDTCFACNDRKQFEFLLCPVCDPGARHSSTLEGFKVWCGTSGVCVVAGVRESATHGVTFVSVNPTPDGQFRAGKQKFRRFQDALRDATSGLVWAGATPFPRQLVGEMAVSS